MAKGSPRVKVTYTYNGKTFSTASKVVAKMAASGNMKGAYNRYISDTIGRTMRGTDMAKPLRAQYRKAIAAGLASVADVKADVEKYKEKVRQNIGNNIKGIYGDLYDQLRDVKSPAAKKLVREVDDIIARYSWAYDIRESYEMNREIQSAVERFKNDNDLSESDLNKIEQAESTFEATKSQYEIVASQKLRKMMGREAGKG